MIPLIDLPSWVGEHFVVGAIHVLRVRVGLVLGWCRSRVLELVVASSSVGRRRGSEAPVAARFAE